MALCVDVNVTRGCGVQTVDVGGMVPPMGGVPVASPAGTMMSPGTHSPGLQIERSPAHPQATVPSPGSAVNTPGELISALLVDFHFSSLGVLFHEWPLCY